MFSCAFCVSFKSSFFTKHLDNCFWRSHAEFVVVKYIDYPAAMTSSWKNIWRWILLILLAGTFDLIWLRQRLKCICVLIGQALVKSILFWREIFRQPNYQHRKMRMPRKISRRNCHSFCLMEIRLNVGFILCLQYIFFYLDFLSQKFTIHRTAGEERGYLFNFSLLLPPTSQTLRH